MYTRTVSLGDDIIDPRDIVERVNELDSELDSALEEWDGTSEEYADFYAEEIAELALWKRILGEISNPEDGEALILESHFENYACQLAEDIGAIGQDTDWPVIYIDWGRAADALKMDYSTYEFDSYTYYQRS